MLVINRAPKNLDYFLNYPIRSYHLSAIAHHLRPSHGLLAPFGRHLALHALPAKHFGVGFFYQGRILEELFSNAKVRTVPDYKARFVINLSWVNIFKCIQIIRHQTSPPVGVHH